MNRILKTFCTIFILPIFLIYLLAPSSMALSPSSEPTYAGIDVSGYQGNINYSEVKQAGIEIVYMKSSEGSNYVDSHFERNYTEAKTNGLKVGVYHFLTARSIAQAETQAQFFVAPVCRRPLRSRRWWPFTMIRIRCGSCSRITRIRLRPSSWSRWPPTWAWFCRTMIFCRFCGRSRRRTALC